VRALKKHWHNIGLGEGEGESFGELRLGGEGQAGCHGRTSFKITLKGGEGEKDVADT